MPPRRKLVPKKPQAATATAQLPMSQAGVHFDHARVAFSYLLDALKDPKHPTACIGTLFYTLSTTAMITLPFAYGKGMSKFDTLWSTLYNFIVAKRTDQEFIAMKDSLSTSCSCKLTTPDSKLVHSQYEKAPFNETNSQGMSLTYIFITVACRMLRSVLDVTKDVRAAKPGASKKWPSVSELYSVGADQVIESLLQWHRFVGDLVVLDLFPGVVRFGGPSIYDSVIRFDAMNVIAMDPIRRRLDKILDALESEPNRAQIAPLRPVYAEFDHLTMGLHSCLEEVYRQPIRSNIRMLNGGETRALQLCSICLYLLPLLAGNITDNGFANAQVIISQHLSSDALYLFRDFKMHFAGRPDIPLHPSIVKIDTDLFGSLTPKTSMEYILSEEELFHEDFVAYAMVESHSNKPCAAPKCDATFREKSKGFQKCSGCSTVGYCSRECQIRAWNPEGDKYPHKQACKIMAKIMKEWKGGWHLDTDALAVDTREGRAVEFRKELEKVLKRMRKEGEMSEDELAFMVGWSTESNGEMNHMPGKAAEWHPGYDDYESILERLTRNLHTPKPVLMGRQFLLDDEKESDEIRSELQNHPFWKNVMDPDSGPLLKN